MKKGLIFPLVLTALPAVAEDYHLFAGAAAIHQDQLDRAEMQYRSYARYFFEKKSALGPFDQFEYINTVSNVEGYTAHYNDVLSTGLSGEHFVNQLAFSGSVHVLDGEYAASVASAGYLASDNLIFRAYANHIDNADTKYGLSSSYNLQLDASDYLGVSLGVREDFESGSLSAKYFNALGNGDYVVVNAYYSTYVSEFSSFSRRLSSWNVDTAYYISKFTNFSLSWSKDEVLSGGAQHFFTPNFALAVDAHYREEERADVVLDYTAFVLSLSWQM